MMLRTFSLLAPVVRPSALPLIVALLPLLGVGEAEAQGSCPCEIRITSLVELSSEPATVAPSLDVSVARTRSGGFAVSPRYRPAAILFYDERGALLATFDRRGSGPNELESAPLLFVDDEGNLHAMDRQRQLTFDGDLAPLGVRRTEGSVSQNAVFLPGGSVATDHRMRTQDGNVFTVTLLGADGRIVDAVSPRRDPEGLAVLGPAVEEGFWVAEVNHSRISRHEVDGTPVRSVTVRRSWFESWEGRIEGELFAVRPRPRTWAVAEVEPDRLLLVTRVVAEGWEPLWPDGTPGMFNAAEIDHSSLWDSVIEAVDASTGEVLARDRAPQAFSPVSGAPDLYFSARTTDLGHVLVEVVRISVEPTG